MMCEHEFEHKIPECCYKCVNLESYEDSYYVAGYSIKYFCALGIFIPAKKKTCKKQRRKTNDV